MRALTVSSSSSGISGVSLHKNASIQPAHSRSHAARCTRMSLIESCPSKVGVQSCDSLRGASSSSKLACADWIVLSTSVLFICSSLNTLGLTTNCLLLECLPPIAISYATPDDDEDSRCDDRADQRHAF